MATLEISKSIKRELMEQANGTTETFGKFGNSKRLIAILEKEGYLTSINQMNNRSYSRRMENVECYYHHSSDKSIVQIVLISLEAGTLNIRFRNYELGGELVWIMKQKKLLTV